MYILYIYNICMFILCVFACLLESINIETAEPIGPIFWQFTQYPFISFKNALNRKICEARFQIKMAA